MKPTWQASVKSPIKIPLLTRKDRNEYEQMRHQLVSVLKKIGGYQPVVDDIYVDQIARAVIYSTRLEVFLDSGKATEYTYSRIIDSKAKLAKTIENSMHQLALNRRDRIDRQTESSLMNELREAMLEGLKAAAEQP